VVPVTSGARTLKDATSEALRHWVTTVDCTHYCIGSVLGPHPYPWLVREFQRVIGDEARAQCAELLSGAGPDVVVPCVGGGSNAAGTFAGFVATPARLVGVEAAGGAAVTDGRPGVLHGSLSSFLQDEDGQIAEARSVSAGLDYPGVGPEHACLAESGRAEYHTATDEEAVAAAELCARTEGILPALESAHALAWVHRAAHAGDVAGGATVLITMSGRGDKDAACLKELVGGRR
jgi:tryptophan synthase beta chain